MTISLLDPQIWASFVTLLALEIVLGIDNIVFISVVVSRLPERRRELARRIGLALALIFRVVLLAGLFWVIGLSGSVLEVMGYDISWRDIVLIAGGLFLLAKATHEIHQDIETADKGRPSPSGAGFFLTIGQIIVIDMVFSVDSIVTAIGIAQHIEVMVAAIVISMIVMYVASVAVSNFIERHPTTKMLALSFLLLIGMALVADGLDFHIPRGYIYFAMAFAALVEVFNVMAGKRRKRRAAAETETVTATAGEEPGSGA